MSPESKAIIHSLKHAPLLAGDIPHAPCFDRRLFASPDVCPDLNFDQKLGHLYEQALQILIDHSPALACLASNLQVFDEDKRTLGEMDFVLFDRLSGNHIHLELAVKFYLARKDADNIWHYPGPNDTDNWHRKLEKLQQHQLCLTDIEQARHMLGSRFDIKTIAARQLIYGCLFLPVDIDMHDAPMPEFLSQQRRQGRWLYRRQWADYFSDVDDVMLIQKPLWPVELSADNTAMLETISTEDLRGMAQERCTMFALKGNPQPWFIVPDDWG